jgi:hypothetical protein
MQAVKTQAKRRVLLTQEEREFLKIIEKIELELKMQKELNGNVSTKRLFDLLNIKSILLNSLLKRAEVK